MVIEWYIAAYNCGGTWKLITREIHNDYKKVEKKTKNYVDSGYEVKIIKLDME